MSLQQRTMHAGHMLTSFLSLVVFVAIDYFSIGSKLFKWEGSTDTPPTAFFSSAVFLLTTYFAQLTYALTSSISTGIAASIIFEAALISRQIAKTCHGVLSEEGCVRPADFYLNVAVCMGLSTLAFACLSFAPYIYKVGDHLKDLPLLAVFSVMTSIGFSILRDAIGEYLAAIFEETGLISLCVALMAGFLIFIAEMFFPDFAFLIPLSSAIIVVIFNLIFRVILGVSTAQLKVAGHVPDFGADANKPIWEVVKLFVGGNINISCLVANVGNILSLVLFNLIHINTNLLPYSFFTKTPVDFNAEWRSQAFSNIITAFTGFPSYFVSSTSIFFYKAGAYTRTASLLGAMAPFLLAMMPGSFRDYVPSIMSSIILSYLGMTFVYSYFIRIRHQISRTDAFTIFMGVIFCQFVSFAAGFAIVAAVAAITSLRYYKASLSSKQARVEVSENVVRVDYVLCFMTVSKLKQDIGTNCTEITLDLLACPYIDMNGNLLISDLAKKLKRVRVLGRPANLYVDMLKLQSNIHLSEAYY